MSGAIAHLLAESAALLARAGVEQPRREARLLLGHALGLGLAAIIAGPDRGLTTAERDRLGLLLRRRAGREPLSRILGQREFWSLPFQVTAATLDPRPDSETIVQAGLDCLGGRGADGSAAPARVLDLGTGTGCLLLALLSERAAATGVGTDRDPAAVTVARANADALGLAARAEIIVGDWGTGLVEDFNLILTNPPYIRDDEIPRLAPEVALYEPRLALSGGPDGLDCIRAIATDMRRLLRPDGHAVVEVGEGQADSAAAIFAAAGLRQVGRARDLGGVERCLVLQQA